MSSRGGEREEGGKRGEAGKVVVVTMRKEQLEDQSRFYPPAVDDGNEAQIHSNRNGNGQQKGLFRTFFSKIVGGNNQVDQTSEEYELLHDTYTFLMAGRYPFETNWGSRDQDQESDEDNEPEQEKTSEASAAISSEEEEGTGVEVADFGMVKRASKEQGQPMAKKRLGTTDSDFMYLPFWAGLFINMSQLFIYMIVIANVFSKNTMPPNADRWLRLAQIFAVSVTLYTQSDFIDGIFLFTERWKPFKGITTPVKFNVSAVLRIISGIIGIISTFILVMYSTEVVDLLLNFTAMEFVAKLDGSAFSIASKGFLGLTLEKKCLEIQEFRYQRRIRHGSLARPFAYCLCVILVFIAFIFVVSLQSRRLVGLENEIYVQLDDTDVPDLYGISGVYVGCQGFRTKGMGDIGYVDIAFGTSAKGSKCPKLTKNKDGKLEIPGRVFVYCWDTDGWVYTTKTTTDPCKRENHLLRSILDGPPVDSNSFDMLTHAKATWVINQRSDTGGETLIDFVFIGSVGSFQNTFTQCDGKGLLPTHFSSVEEDISPLANNQTYYPYFDDKSYQDVFGLIYRPIFQKKFPDYENRFEVVLFDGLRWHYMYLNPSAFAEAFNKLDECDKESDPECWRVFIQYHHTFPEWVSLENVVAPVAISTPMRFLTASDTGVPSVPTADGGVEWYHSVVLGRGANTRVRPGQEIFSGFIGGDGPVGFECARATPTIQCNENEQALGIIFDTDEFANENNIFVFLGQDESNIQQLNANSINAKDAKNMFNITDNTITGFAFSDSFATYELLSCAPKSDTSCVQIIVTDSYGDGIYEPGRYQIIAGDDYFARGVGVELSGDNGFNCRRYQFGGGCVSQGDGDRFYSCDKAFIYDNFPGELIFSDDDAEDFAGFFGEANIFNGA